MFGFLATQVDGKVPADPRSVTWTAVVKKNEIHIVHKATVTNVCTLRVGGGTLLVQQVTTGSSDSAAKSTSEGGDGEGGGLTLAVVATGLASFTSRPAEFDGLPPALASHSSDQHDLSRFIAAQPIAGTISQVIAADRGYSPTIT